MRQLFRFIFIAAALFWLFAGFIGVGLGVYRMDHTILDTILGIIFILFIAMALFLAARWCNKGKEFDITKDGLYVFKHIGFAILIYFSMGLIGLLLGACKKFFSF